MHPFTIVMILMIGGAILFCCIPLIFQDTRKAFGIRKLLTIAGGMLVSIGVVGFFGSALSAVGGLNWLGASLEWPAGFVSGVVTTEQGVHIIPHTPSGRIQIYDANWKFIRGWPVDAGGGTFKLSSTETNTVEVVTARGQWRYVFDFNGNLLNQENYSPATYSNFPESGEAYFIPTKPWLWVFSHPFLSWGTAVCGITLLIVDNKFQKRRKAKR
jgi:hypothetical protein